MKRKNVAIVLCVMAFSLCSGCNKKVDEIDFNEDMESIQTSENMSTEDINEKEGADTEDKKNSESIGETIQDEIARVEAKSKEIEDASQDCNTQTDMNINAGEWFKVWDEELNSLWDRLNNEVDAETKEKLLKEQREWIARKEANIKAASEQCMGGSIVPLIENSVAADMTRARVYKLAGYLAEQRNETFTISDDIQAQLDMADPSLDDVFRTFEGQWIFDEAQDACIGIERTEDCAYGVEGSNWTVWITGGDLLSDNDLYEYTAYTITFKKEHDGNAEYYELSHNFSDGVMLTYGTSPDEIYEVLACVVPEE